MMKFLQAADVLRTSHEWSIFLALELLQESRAVTNFTTECNQMYFQQQILIL